MKTKRISQTIIWAVVAVLLVCVSACSKEDIPQPQPQPNPEQVENPEDWGDEVPHVFYFDLDRIELNLNEDGFLMIRNTNKSYSPDSYIDHIVIDSTKIAPSVTSNEKQWAVNGPLNDSYFRLKGKRATPFNNVDVYKRCCLQVAKRPDSKYNNFPELSHLNTISMMEAPASREIAFDTVVYMDIITHKYYDANHPAGSSVRSSYAQGRRMSVGVFFGIFNGVEFFKSNTGYVGPYGGIDVYSLGKCNAMYPGAGITVYVIGYPEAAGDYPMTLYIELASGRTLSKDFKIRFVNKK